jgi:hypothetical protein
MHLFVKFRCLLKLISGWRAKKCISIKIRDDCSKFRNKLGSSWSDNFEKLSHKAYAGAQNANVVNASRTLASREALASPSALVDALKRNN